MGKHLMRRLCSLLVLNLCAAFAVSVLAQENAAQPRTGDTDVQKLDAMMTFMRNRNAQDYAITAPNGIDEARYVEIGGIEQWITIRGEDRKQSCIAVPAWGARRCHESVGIRRVSLVVENIHRRSMGSARRRQDVGQEWPSVCVDHHDSAHDSGWNRTR